MTGRYVLAIDSGSSSTRSVLIDTAGRIVGEGRASVPWKHRRPGWAELDPILLWNDVRATISAVLQRVGADAHDIAAVGVTTHRETIVMWDPTTGLPAHDALVWISQQTDDIVARWQAAGLDGEFRRRTGLRNDSFFSAAKIAWLLENVPGLRARAEAGAVICGTVDTWLLWNLTGGPNGGAHATDHSCASRTALLNLAALAWDGELCELLGIPPLLLADVRGSDSAFGRVDPSVLATRPPVTAVIADQQAGMFGQACFEANSAKNTFGTAGVLTVNSGPQPLIIDGLTASVAWSVQGHTDYEVEGVVFHSGQTLQWLRDGLGLFSDTAEVEAICAATPDTGGVYLVPAFGGLCAPYWDRAARATLYGATLATAKQHIVRAGVEAMAFQTVDNLRLSERAGIRFPELKVDGGGATSDTLCQFLADISGIPIIRPRELERTALGVAYLAGTGVGIWNGPADVKSVWQQDRTFEPTMSTARREELYAGWLTAVDRTLTIPKTST